MTNGVEFPVTWNFRHLSNAAMRVRIESACRQAGYEPPVICPPSSRSPERNRQIERWLDTAAYMGDDTPGDVSRLSFPGYGVAAAPPIPEDQ